MNAIVALNALRRAPQQPKKAVRSLSCINQCGPNGPKQVAL